MKPLTPIEVVQNSETDAGAVLAPVAGSESWRVYRLNDCDWWLARSIAEAKQSAAEYYGCESTDDEIFQDDVHELTAEELEKHRYHTDDNRKGPTISFREELHHRVAAGPKPEMFASTEF